MQELILNKKQIINKLNLKKGSIEYQIIFLTFRINKLKIHVKNYSHDYQTRINLIKIINKRRKLLNYLNNNNIVIYKIIKKELNLK